MATGYVFVPGSPSGWELASSSNLPSVVDVTDGTTTVSAVTSIDFTSGATVTSGGAGVADVAISGGSGVSSLDSITGAISLIAGSNITISDNSPSSGDITIASSGAGGGLNVLFDQTLASAAATIDTGASGVASGHGDLLILLQVRSTYAAYTDYVLLTFNADTSANYSREQITGISNSAPGSFGSGTDTSISWPMNAATSPTNWASPAFMFIPSYDATTLTKSVAAITGKTETATANAYAQFKISGYASTSAISQVTATAQSGTFVAGSRMVVYGLQ